MATALIQPLAWEPPYATGGALKKKKKRIKGKRLSYPEQWITLRQEIKVPRQHTVQKASAGKITLYRETHYLWGFDPVW